MKNTQDLIQRLQIANLETIKYFHQGYDIYFIHGWFYSYILALGENDDDLWFPDYLVLDEDKITDEKIFVKFIDDLLLIYTDLANNTFEKNHLISILTNVEDIDNTKSLQLSRLERQNLLNWLYGYLSGCLASWNADEVEKSFNNQQELEDKFYQALFYLCGAFLKLDDEIKPKLNQAVLDDYMDLKLDIADIWELSNNEMLSQFNQAINNTEVFDYKSNINNALNTLFNIMRSLDEKRL